jgi:hydrophobe/amphiphile efflux-3 (HAE3) family protein
MEGIIDMIDSERLGAWIVKNSAIIIAVAVLFTIFSVHYAQKIENQGETTESHVSKDSALYQLYDHLYLENFGRSANVILVEGDDVAREDVLQASMRFSDHMKQVHNAAEVQSIADIVADTEYQCYGIHRIPSQERIEEILADTDISAAIQSLMPDRKHSMMIVTMLATLTDVQKREILSEINNALSFAEFPAGFNTDVTGDPSFQIAIDQEINDSCSSLFALCVVMMILALRSVFRHVRWPLLPLPVVILGAIWTFGAMGFFHVPMSMVTIAAIPIMIGVGIDYAIQFHNRFDEELSNGKNFAEAAVDTIRHVAIPVLIAMCITEAGFVSLLSSSVPMINDFGKTCIIGLIMCYLSGSFVNITILYLSEKRSPRMKKEGGYSSGSSAIGALITRIATFCIERGKLVLAAALLLALAGICADTEVSIETNMENYIPQDLDPLIELRHMKAIFGGTDSIIFLVQTDDITEPENLMWIDDFSNYLLKSREDRTESVTSVATYVKEANGGEIPGDKTIIRRTINSLPTQIKDAYVEGHNLALIEANVGDAATNLGTEGMDRLIKSYERDLAWMAPPPDVSVRITGEPVLMATVMDALTSGRVQMSLLGLLLIFILLLIVYRDLIRALLPVLPMLVVIGWMGLAMYYGGLKYTALTATLGSLILGVGSEYAIMMMERFYEELNKVGDPIEAMRIASYNIGSALLASGMTTVFGFAALISSPFNIISNFGLVTVLSVLLALITTFTIFVVLMIRMEIQREVLNNAKRELAKAIALISIKSWRKNNGE